MSNQRKHDCIRNESMDYSTSADEILSTIDEVALRRLGMDSKQVIEICESGKWDKDEANYELWSWLRNLVISLNYLNGKLRKRQV